jgi:hydrogenase/urease accessory protein HupE
MARRSVRLALALCLVFALGTAARAAWAHAVGLSRGEYTLTGEVVAAELTFARSDVDGLDALALLRGIIVRADGKRCTGVADSMALVNAEAVALRARFGCADARDRLDIRIALFDLLPEGHRHALHLREGARVVDDLLYRAHDAASLVIDGSGRAEAAKLAGPLLARRTSGASLLGMMWMGVEHILTGYDHLVFLLAVVVVGGSRRELFAVVTAFTVAHSMTLAVAALGVWTPPARIIEPAIGLSIAYVGVENFAVRSAEKRWRITFPFGLLHGFGFASALRDLALPPSEAVASLLSFNVGVELGQLTVLAVLLPLLARLRSAGPFTSAGIVRTFSVAAVVMGAFWFVTRLVRAPA